jgi:hypothetical protein
MGKFQREEAARLYERMMGADAAERQRKAAIKARGGCVCATRLIKKRWDGETLSVKTIHEEGCVKWRWWMAETDRL